jgi:signal transduction histidine kinase/ActR/RegA family two-component response regulator
MTPSSPRDQPPAPSPGEQPSLRTPGEHESADTVNILIVDDQPGKLLTYEAMLGDLGETLLTASSARQALEHLLRSEVAVMLVDVCMPELDGFELAAMMRAHPRFQKTPIIFVSGVYLTEFDRLKGYASGAVDYVPVPVVPEILRAKVGVFVDLFRKTRDLERLNRELERRVAERTAELEASTANLRDREEALREADRRKDEFLAMLAHEIRNPLAPIRTAVHLLRLKELPEAQRVHARDVIERQVEHLVRLIDDLLDVSRITRGAIKLQRERVDVAEVVARAVETSRPLIDSRRHQLVTVLPDQSLSVFGDLTRLSQVLANLLNNAAKYTDAQGRIFVRVERDGGEVVIRVQDNGIGISREMLSRVFELFAQADRTLERSSGGLGIGLALVRRLVEMHGGSVSAYSGGAGQGTEMVVRLPVDIDDRMPERPREPECLPAAPTAGTPAVSPAAASRRILIVDDNRDAADSMALLVETAGHSARTAYDGHQALDLASAFVPDVLLLDLGVPGLNGFEIARRIRRQPWGKTVALIAVTGWGQEQDRRRTAEAGFDAHLIKPVGHADLLSALRACGRAARPSSEPS